MALLALGTRPPAIQRSPSDGLAVGEVKGVFVQICTQSSSRWASLSSHVLARAARWTEFEGSRSCEPLPMSKDESKGGESSRSMLKTPSSIVKS